MKKVKKIVLYAVIAIAVIGSSIVMKNKLASSAATESVAVNKRITAVEAQEVKAVEKNLSDTYKANLEAKEQGSVVSKVSSKIIKVAFENGQYVNAGDTLIVLDDQDIQNSIESAQSQLGVTQQQLNSAEASLEKIKLNLDDTQRTYDRQKILLESGAISKVDFDSAEKALNSAKADYKSGLASIESAKANIALQNVTIANYQDSLKNTVIKAPISAVVSDKNVTIGQMASSGTVLAKVNDISSIYATIQIPQEKISSVKIGQPANITISGNDKVYNGAVKTIDVVADSTARVFNCKVQINNSDKTLYPGVFTKVDLISEQKTQIISVPINALVGSEGDYSVFVNDNGIVKKQKVTIGETDENNVEITSGIKNGDIIICSNTSTLQDGDEIDAVFNENNISEEENSKQNGDNAEMASKQEE